jgi:signal transduction histidine kinase
LARERKARQEAEAIAERVTGELYAAVEKLAQTNRDLEDANQSMKEFVAIASHDLNNPLISIVGFADTLLQQATSSGDEHTQQALRIILNQGARMGRLIEDLLFLSSLEAGAVQPHTMDVVVAWELERSIEQLGDEGAAIRMHADAELVVRADPDHVQRILGNYLTNALKYGAAPITAEAASEGNFVDVRVCDHGRGIPEEFTGRLFSKFSRSETEETRSHPGTGLGLSIVRGLAVANGGDVWYEPNAPEGSCFGVSLPRAALGKVS